MARCGCEGSCGCATIGTDGETVAVDVSGNGAPGTPYAVTAEAILVPDGEGPLAGDNALKAHALGLYVDPDGDAEDTTDWVEPAVGTGWTIFGTPYEVPRYRKFRGVVYMEGLVQNTSGDTLGPADVVFTLPAGFRPRAVISAIPFSAAKTEITGDGEVRVNDVVLDDGYLTLTFSFLPSQ